MGLADWLKDIGKKIKKSWIGDESIYFTEDSRKYCSLLMNDRTNPRPHLKELTDCIVGVSDLQNEELMQFWDDVYTGYMVERGEVPGLMELIERGDGNSLNIVLGDNESFCRRSGLDFIKFPERSYYKLRAGIAYFYSAFLNLGQIHKTKFYKIYGKKANDCEN